MLLLSLPTEVLNTIVECLLPTLGLRGDPVSYLPNPSYVVNRHAIFNLTLACRRLSEIAKPFLYRIIVLQDGETMVLLLRTLLENSRLRDNIRAVATVVDLSWGSDVDNDFFEDQVWDLAAMTSFERRIFQLASLDAVAGADDFEDEYDYNFELVQGVFAAILCFANRLNTLSLRLPHITVEYHTLDHILNRLLNAADVRAQIMPSISRLMLKADPDQCHIAGTANACPSLLRFSSIRQLNMSGDIPQWDHPSIIAAEIWQNLEEIRLHYSCTLGPGWYELCIRCPNLKVVNISISPYATPSDFNIGETCLNHGLLKRADSLQSLSIDPSYYDYFLDELGADRRLTCLPNLSNLSHLRVALCLLFESPHNLSKLNLVDMLPKSLVSLDLDEGWSPYDDPDMPDLPRYCKNIEDMLLGIVVENRLQLPNLRSVRFKKNTEYWQELVLSVEFLSGRAGVEFKVVKTI
jgi:hypothetical protein